MQPNLTDATIEYLFSPQEEQVARQLDVLKIAWYQTKYAKIWKERASQAAPIDPNLYETYFKRLAELDGQLMMLQEILDDHKTVMRTINEAKAVMEERAKREQQDLAERAAKQVHKTT